MFDLTLPSILYGTILSAIFGALFHLWKNGGIGRLIIYLFLSWAGFWIGHFVGYVNKIDLVTIGAIRFGTAILGSSFFLVIGYWLGKVRND